MLLGESRWKDILLGSEYTSSELDKFIYKPWVIGFIEGDGSLYITKKEENRYSHGFGITQKGHPYLLHALRKRFRVNAKIQRHKYPGIWKIDTTNKRTIFKLVRYFKGQFKGISSLRYMIWSRSFINQYKPAEMRRTQSILRGL